MNFLYFELYSALLTLLHTCNFTDEIDEITPDVSSVHDSGISLLLQFASVQSICS